MAEMPGFPRPCGGDPGAVKDDAYYENFSPPTRG